jgi:hypothetical protein
LHIASVGLKGVPTFSSLQLQNQPEAYQNIHSQDASECGAYPYIHPQDASESEYFLYLKLRKL